MVAGWPTPSLTEFCTRRFDTNIAAGLLGTSFSVFLRPPQQLRHKNNSCGRIPPPDATVSPLTSPIHSRAKSVIDAWTIDSAFLTGGRIVLSTALTGATIRRCSSHGNQTNATSQSQIGRKLQLMNSYLSSFSALCVSHLRLCSGITGANR